MARLALTLRKRTNLVRQRRHGFRVRSSLILNRRRRKGRSRLSA